MKHSLIFISTPYSHKEHEVENIRYRQAIEYAAILMNQNRFSYSPIASGLAIAKNHSLPTDWDYWGNFCEAMMERCDEVHVLMLNGWKESTGVNSEIEVATRLGKTIVYVDPKDVLKETLDLKTHAQMMQQLEEFLKSDAGKASIEKMRKEDETNKRIEYSQLVRFNRNYDSRFVEILEKFIKKYESDEYVNKCYKRGFEPDTPMYFFFYMYAKKYGRKATKAERKKHANQFTGGLVYIHGYFFNMMHGQGTVINVIKENE